MGLTPSGACGKRSRTVEGSRIRGQGWNPRIVESVTALVREHGRGGPRHDPRRPPVAVLDWDDTAVFHDFGERVLRRQIEALLFGMSPEEMAAFLPDRPRGVEFLSREFGGARIADVSADALRAYERIHARYAGLAGKSPIGEIRATDDYRELAVKLNLLFDGPIATEGLGKAFTYPWSMGVFAGLSRETVRRFARSCWDLELATPIAFEEWRSPETLSTCAGPQRLRLATGIRPVPEMQGLIRTFAEAGFEVFVVTASLQDVIEPVACDPGCGYALAAGHVLGMRLITNNDRYTREIDRRDGYDVTYGPGKVNVIRNVIGRSPLLAAGDSDTDLEMLTAFPETVVRIVVGEPRGARMAALVEKCRRREAGFFQQHRNEATATFLPEP